MRRQWNSLGRGAFVLAIAGALGLGATQAVADPLTGTGSGRSCQECHMQCAEAGCLGQCGSWGCNCFCN